MFPARLNVKKNKCRLCNGFVYSKELCYTHLQNKKYKKITMTEELKKKISHLQTLWLHSRGGRIIDDVVVRDNEFGVYMFSKREENNNKTKEVFVPLPTDQWIKKLFSLIVGAESKIVLRNKERY